MATSIIEKVTNESGSGYCKMPDGTLICYGDVRVNIASGSWIDWKNDGSIFRCESQPTNGSEVFAKQFSSSDVYICLAPFTDENVMVVNVSVNSAAISKISFARPLTRTGDFYFHYIAIGRWK